MGEDVEVGAGDGGEAGEFVAVGVMGVAVEEKTYECVGAFGNGDFRKFRGKAISSGVADDSTGRVKCVTEFMLCYGVEEGGYVGGGGNIGIRPKVVEEHGQETVGTKAFGN